MLKRYRVTAIALGLICLPILGQAQEEAGDEKGQASQQEQPAKPYPLPFPVEIVEDQTEADARKRREAESRQNEIDDLAAQQGMNEATRAMNDATQEMRDYAYVQTWLVGIGSVLLFATLYYAREANGVSREIGQKQVRAYLADDGVRIHWSGDKLGEPRIENIEVSIKNTGQSPALLCGISMLIHGVTPEEFGHAITGSENALRDRKLGTLSIASGHANFCGGEGLTEEETRGWLNGEHFLIIHTMSRYKDVFGNEWTTETCQSAHHMLIAGEPKVRFKIYPHHNSST